MVQYISFKAIFKNSLIDFFLPQVKFTSLTWTEPNHVPNSHGKISTLGLSLEWYTRAEEKWSVRVREAATDKRITPLLSTPGAVILKQRNTVKKGKTLIFFSVMFISCERSKVTTWHTILLCIGQWRVFSPTSKGAFWGVTLFVSKDR